jgi:hypothetical protein
MMANYKSAGQIRSFILKPSLPIPGKIKLFQVMSVCKISIEFLLYNISLKKSCQKLFIQVLLALFCY